MSVARRPVGGIEELRGLSTHQELLRVAILLAAVAGLVVTALAGGVALPGIAIVGLAALAAAARPDSHAGAVAVIGLCWQWFAGVDDQRTPWAIGAAAAVLVVHAAAALATVGPPTAALSPAMLRRWATRAGILLGGTIVVWGTAFALAELNTGPNVVIAAAGALALLGVIRLMWPHDPDAHRPSVTRWRAPRSSHWRRRSGQW